MADYKSDIPAGSTRIGRGTKEWKRLYNALRDHYSDRVADYLDHADSDYDALYITPDGQQLYGVYGTEEVFADLLVGEEALAYLGRRTWLAR